MSGPRRDCTCPHVKHQHGTYASYASCGCRCFACRVASAERRRGIARGVRTPRALPLTSRVGTIRRLEALHAIGWSGAEIARTLGRTTAAVDSMRSRSSQLIYEGTARRVAELYERLWDTPGTGPCAARTRRWAQRNGWLPPLAWDDIDDPDEKHPVAAPDVPSGSADPDDIDWVAVERAVAGQHVTLTVAERIEVARRLAAKGWTHTAIARHLGMSWARVNQVLGVAA